MVKELERQRQQEELLATGRAKALRTQRARDRLAATERQITEWTFASVQLVLVLHSILVVLLVLIPPQHATRQPHVAQRETFLNTSEQPLASESGVSIPEPIRNITFPRPTQLEQPEDSMKLTENLLSSLFPSLVFRARSAASVETAHIRTKTADNENSKAELWMTENQKGSARKPWSSNVTDTSGSPEPSPVGESVSPVEPISIKTEQTQVDSATALLSVENIRHNLIVVLHIELGHYPPSAGDCDEGLIERYYEADFLHERQQAGVQVRACAERAVGAARQFMVMQRRG